MVRNGKFYIGGDLVLGFGVDYRGNFRNPSSYYNWTTLADGTDICSDPFSTPEDALANLLTVLNEG
jgi:hypothetical protein